MMAGAMKGSRADLAHVVEQYPTFLRGMVDAETSVLERYMVDVSSSGCTLPPLLWP